MFEYLRGRVAGRGPDSVVIDVGGIGFALTTTTATAETLPPVGEEVQLWTHLHIRDDVRDFYGFATREERQAFVQLLGVTGIGPRMARATLSLLPAERLAGAIEAEDIAALARVPGVGRKTASRMVLDLKGKIALGDGVTAAASGDDEVVSALQGYGFSAAQARELVEGLPRDPTRDVSETLRLAFQAHNARRERS